ncbi:pitrilysin family protein [uncultured Faecalibaculum sp.]|uniref:M16 family metallopeptidase n=1 Tax=uncultured Faecalibaculum sp. TaxID=1729681 RepID=UPI0026322D9E|nr:pitrilysin family protein [uncultured Faecalibaculum sp.]
MKRIEKRLSNGARVGLIQKPGFSRSLFLAGFETGGLYLQGTLEGKRFQAPSGAAHFLEHQMFRLNGRDVTDDMAALQASTNAYTAFEETAYYFSTTADPLPPLSLLLDFVQTLDVDEASVEKEKGIILSEYDMYDQNPESRLLQETMNSLYHVYPLNTDILGTPGDIQGMTVEDLTKFYNTWYDPSRMVIIGITPGPLEPVLAFIEAHEQKYPSRLAAQPSVWFDPEPAAPVRSAHSLVMEVSRPYVCIGFKFQPEGDVRENLKKDLAVNFWIDGMFSSLNPAFQDWVDARILTQVYGAEGEFSQHDAYMLFYAQTDKTEAFRDLVMDLVLTKPQLSETTFEILKRQNLARSLRLSDSFQGLAQKELEAAFDGVSLEEQTEMARRITLEDVRDAVNSLNFENCTLTTILPRERGVME